MATGLAVQLGFSMPNGGGFNPQIDIFCDRLVIDATRNPVISVLPNQNAGDRKHNNPGTGTPRALVIDFGLMQENIQISGKLIDDIPFAYDLPHLLRTQWVRQKLVVLGAKGAYGQGIMKILIHGPTDLVYGVVPVKFNFSRQGGIMEWVYNITFSVVTWPEETPFFGS